MRVVDLIEKKRDNHKLTEEEIKFLLDEYLGGNVPDIKCHHF